MEEIVSGVATQQQGKCYCAGHRIDHKVLWESIFNNETWTGKQTKHFGQKT